MKERVWDDWGRFWDAQNRPQSSRSKYVYTREEETNEREL